MLLDWGTSVSWKNALGLREKNMRSPEVIPRDWRESCGEGPRSSCFRLRERCREAGVVDKEEEEEILCVRSSLRWWTEQELGTSILWVSLDSRDLSLSFMASSRFIELFSLSDKRRSEFGTELGANSSGK